MDSPHMVYSRNEKFFFKFVYIPRLCCLIRLDTKRVLNSV